MSKKQYQVLAILQARVSSSRLPNKVLLPILGKAMLERQCQRILRSKRIDKLVIATSNNPEDKAIAELADKLGIACYSGSLDDVLARFYFAALQYPSEHIVRLTGDCPLTDPEIIDDVIQYHLEQGADYTSNCEPPSFPDGLDVEVFTSKALEEAYLNADKPSEREHVTPYIRRQTGQYQLSSFIHPQDHSDYRWTVDEPTDFEFVSKVYEALYPDNKQFKTDDIFLLLREQPELQSINAGIQRNEGYLKSLINEGEAK